MRILRLFKFTRMLFFLEVIFGFLLANNFMLDKILFFMFFSFTFLIYNSIYIINDISDINEDKLHPEKKKRAIASGTISVKFALTFAILSILLGLIIGYFINIKFLIFEFIFIFINLSYSFYFKDILYLDIIFNSLTHPLRFYMGIIIAGSYDYLIIVLGIFFLSNALSTLKRENEFIKGEILFRETLKKYTIKKFVYIYIVGCISLVILFLLEQEYKIIIAFLILIFSIMVVGFHISKSLQKRLNFLLKF